MESMKKLFVNFTTALFVSCSCLVSISHAEQDDISVEIIPSSIELGSQIDGLAPVESSVSEVIFADPEISEGGSVSPASSATSEVEKANVVETEALAITPLVYDASYTPYCTELSINTLYYLTPVTGSTYCIYFDIDEDSRTEFTVYDQTEGTQVSLQVFQDTNADYTFYSLGSSSDTDADDSVIAYTEAGHYYMQFVASSSAGDAVYFAAASNTNIDEFESNDSTSDVTVLTDDINEISANLDYIGDYDYFAYESDHGQNLYLALTDTIGNNQWILEYLS